MRSFWGPLRKRIVRLALEYPPLISALMFLFLLTFSNQIYFATSQVIPITSFRHMLLIGALMATFGAVLLYELLRSNRRLAQIDMIRPMARTLLHGLNNPLQVIQLSAEKLKTLDRYDDESVKNIIAQVERIGDLATKLIQLQEDIFLHREPGFAGLIDLERSR